MNNGQFNNNFNGNNPDLNSQPNYNNPAYNQNNQQNNTQYNNSYEASAPQIKLTLDPLDSPNVNVDTNLKTIDQQVQESMPEKLDESRLTEQERKMVHDFANQIDITNSNQILQFGAGAQKNVSSFSEAALQKVRAQDMGEIGGMLSSLIVELKGFDIEADGTKKIGWFKKMTNKFEVMKSNYASVEKNIDGIAQVLQNHQIRLMKDIAMLDQMYELNLNYYKELTMYILAGKKKLNQALQNDLPALRRQAELSGKPEDAQRANDFSSMCNRFEKKLHDLELTRIISIQMAPQIRLVQNNDSMMVEKIQSSLVNTIPLWKNQMVLALGIANSQQALSAQRAVTDMTNELLRRNADVLKMGTIETAKESERSIVDIETLKHTNEQLIGTIDEVLRIQEDGRQKRIQAEGEMMRLEGQLKQKLLQVKQ